MDSDERAKRNKKICKLSARGMDIAEIAEALNLTKDLLWQVRDDNQSDNAQRCANCKKFRKASEFDVKDESCTVAVVPNAKAQDEA